MTPEKVLILDTTLRDGEQTAGVSFNADEKLTLAKILLEELKVNRIEVCSARVSEGEFHMLSRLCSWAGTRGYIDRVVPASMDMLYSITCWMISIRMAEMRK